MTLDEIIGGGFTVAIDELRRMADVLTVAHDDELDRHHHEQHPHPGGGPASRGTGRVAAAEREWNRRHTPLLADLAAAGPALHATADTYLGIDDQLAELEARAKSGTLATSSATRRPAASTRHDEGAAWPDPTPPDPTPLEAAVGDDQAKPAADNTAIVEELRHRWRTRAVRADTVAVALQTSQPEQWRGPAAEAFDHWRHHSHTGWNDLIELADTVAATLNTTTAPTRGAAAVGHPHRGAPTDAPTNAATSVPASDPPTEPERPHTAPVGSPPPEPPPGPPPEAPSDGVTVTVTGPHTHVSVDVRHEGDGGDGDDGDKDNGDEGSAQASSQRPPAPGHTPPNDTHPDHDDHTSHHDDASTASPIRGPDSADTPPPVTPIPTPPVPPGLSSDPARPVGIDNTAASTSTAVTGDGAGTGPHLDDAAAPGAVGVGIGVTAAAAAAAAMLLARRDRHPRPAPITGHPDTLDPLTGPVTGSGQDAPRSHAPQPGTAGDTPVGRHPEPEPSPASRWQPDLDSAPHIPPAPRPRSNPTRAHPPHRERDSGTDPTSRWVHIGTHAGGPVLLDPAATGGLGLTGPGAPDVARALLLALAATGEPLTALTAADTAHTLLGGGPRQATQPAGGTGWLHVLHDPLTALHATEHEIHQRRRRDTARPDPARAGWWVIVVAAPTTSAAADRLRAALATGARHRITAIIAGHWPHGWNATIDTDHRITHHTPTTGPHAPTPHQPAPHEPDLYGPDLYGPDLALALRPAYLAGAHLFHTTAAELRAQLPTPGTAPTPGTTPVPATNTTQPTRSDTTPVESPPATQDAPGRPDDHHRDPYPAGDVDWIGEPPVFDLPTFLTADRPDPPGDHDTPNPATDNPTTPPDVATTTIPITPHLPAGSAPARVPPMRLSILGPATLTRACPDPTDREQVIDGIGPRALELLVYLAVHPHGVARDTLIAALWPDTGPDRPTNALNAALTRLRRALRATDPDHATLVTLTGDRYHLDGDLVDIDYWTFLIAAADLTHPDPTHRVHACETLIHTYQGPVAVDLTGEWLITLREAARRRYLDALTTLARHTIDQNPIRTLGLLETARNLEPVNEGVYRDIMRIQARLHRYDAAATTLDLLKAQLADIGATPDPVTLDLADTITAHARRDTDPDARSA